MNYRGIKADFKKNWLFLAILFVASIPMILRGYTTHLFFLLFIIIILRYRIKFTKELILCALFGIFYTLPLIFHKNVPTTSTLIFNLVYPFLFYLIPQYLGNQFKHKLSLLLVTAIMITCMASWSIYMSIYDAIVSGNIVDPSRSLHEALSDSDINISATGQNMRLALAMGGVGMIFVKAYTTLEHRFQIVMIIIGLLALFSGLHLLNRTAIGLVLVACMVPFFVNKFSSRYLNWIFFLSFFLLIVYVLFLQDSSFIGDIVEGIQTRNTNSRYSVESAGGRDVRMLAAIEQIPRYPWGNDVLEFMNSSTYAHNTWLDCGVQSGWIAMFILIVITVYLISSLLILATKNKRVPSFWRCFLIIISCVLLVQLSVEPGIQGNIVVFSMMFYLWSVVNIMNKGNNNGRSRYHNLIQP